MRHKYGFKETEFNSKKDQFRGGGVTNWPEGAKIVTQK